MDTFMYAQNQLHFLQLKEEIYFYVLRLVMHCTSYLLLIIKIVMSRSPGSSVPNAQVFRRACMLLLRGIPPLGVQTRIMRKINKNQVGLLYIST